MAKNKISEYSTTAGANTDINGINIDEGCPPANINNAIRSLMAALKGWQGGTVAGDVLSVEGGGTGTTTSTGSGANVLATSPTLVTPILGTPTSGTLTNCNGLPLATGVTGTLSTANGGTGTTTFTGTGSNVLSASPTFTGIPLAPTASAGTNTTQIATTAFVTSAVGAATTGVSSFNTRTGAVTLNSTDVTNALSFTPVSLNTTQTVSGNKTFSGSNTFSSTNTFTGAFGVGSANPAAGVWAGYSRSLSATNPAFVMDGTTSANSICSAYFGGAGGGDTVLFGQFLYGSQLSNTVVGSISSTGTSTSFNTSSDRRLKKDIEPMTDGLEKTMLLKPVKYVWKINNEPSQGFIADELQEVIPEAVTGEPNGVYPDGKPKYQGIDTSFMIATLTSAIQEQQTIIEDLKSRILALESN
jgi:hypothetical protein